MTARSTREFVLNAMERANASGLRAHPGRTGFLDGACDIAFGDIEFDSLARMELCIAIEVRTGIEILPDELDDIGSLGRLAELLEERVAPQGSAGRHPAVGAGG